ncbi:MAG: hypothetical protein ABI947_22345 [Chloroflexota bacterium]
MSLVNNILSTLQEKYLTDLLVEGFVDKTENPLKFHAMLSHWYLKFEDVYLRCTSIGQADRLRIEFIDQVTLSFDMDEDDQFCISSVYEMRLPYTGPSHTNYVAALKLFSESETYFQAGILKRAEFQLGIVGTLFLEPTIYGIYIGKEQDRDKWMQNNLDANSDYEFAWERNNQ